MVQNQIIEQVKLDGETSMTGNLFYASDKAIFDALIQRKITNENLAELFFERGIIVSKKTDREELSKYFSRNIHDYYDHQFIAKVFGTAPRKEKTISQEIKNDIPKEEIEEILREVCDTKANPDEVYNLVTTDDGFNIDVLYQVIDYNKTEFKQVVQREASIAITKDNDGWTLKSPLNDYIENVRDLFLDKVSTSIDEELIVERIELNSILFPDARTKFFEELINSVSGYSCIDVTDVYVHNPNEMDESETHISKATLKGNGVLESIELKKLYEKNFYLWKINWKIKTGKHDSDLYEIEAQFADAENCDKFSYVIKGFYKFISKDEYNKTKTSLSKEDELRISKLLDNAAKKTMFSIKKEFGT